MNLYICDGRWKDDGRTFHDVVMSDGHWDGAEDDGDEQIFFYTDGNPVVGDHGEFVITDAKECGYGRS